MLSQHDEEIICIRWQVHVDPFNPTQKTEQSANIGRMMDHCIRRWPNIVPKLAECFRFAGYSMM